MQHKRVISNSLVEAKDVKVWFPVRTGLLRKVVANVKAVDGVNLSIAKGEVLGLVGESGSGKTTLGRAMIKLLNCTAGEVRFDDIDLGSLSSGELRAMKRRMQIIFQDPFSSLNPRQTVGEIVAEPLIVHKLVKSPKQMADKVGELLETVGLSNAYADRYPHEFSGGQRQRIGIARALAIDPEFIVADEPVSALDVSIQAQVLNLLDELRVKFNLTMLFISHDLAVVQHIADRVAVMYLGRLVEISDKMDIYINPQHPYTRALMSALPEPDPELRKERIILGGDIPSPLNPPSGCVFRTRCQYAVDACSRETPTLREVSPGHLKACIRDGLF
jgi:oligopeptide/dipeptide ABC transporter ATP-binding protein